MSQRWKLETDDSCHWYLIKAEDSKLFDTLLTSEDETDFEDIFGDKRINGPFGITFEKPLEK